MVRAIEQFQQFHGVGVFLPTFHPLVPLTYWAPAKPLPKLGNIRTGDINRIFPVTAHSKGKEARKLDFVESSEESSREIGFLGILHCLGQNDKI